tara:strand:- start:1181 stop:1486 length:306 start_codon:yes stop_codon:yes gene_type:complete
LGPAPSISEKTPFNALGTWNSGIGAYLSHQILRSYVETQAVLQFILIVSAILLFLYIVRNLTRSTPTDEETYSGTARSPENLYEPSEEAISEMEGLISKLN